MKPFVWNEGMTDEETKNGAYWERNMLALMLATILSDRRDFDDVQLSRAGWYYDTDNNWEGWKRVISFNNGAVTFHIPDDFDTGDLSQIEPNWDGHTTEEKWLNIMYFCGIKRE